MQMQELATHLKNKFELHEKVKATYKLNKNKDTNDNTEAIEENADAANDT